MDTISVKLRINYFNKEVNINDLNRIITYINNIKSPYGYTYCDFLELNSLNEAIIKISYPRFYFGNNGYLVTDSKKCTEVTRNFCDNISLDNFFYKVEEIVLIRVDIPFTYLMPDDRCFWNFENLYRIFAYVYMAKNKNSNPKMISTILDKRVETLNYTDTKVVGNYNSKIMIYDQYKNLEDKLEDFQLKKTIDTFSDLRKRIRLEVSKRISRKGFSIEEFFNYDIYSEYYIKFKNYLLENFLDLSIIEELYNGVAIHLAERLKEDRNSQSFKYEVFLLNNINDIFDYEIIRRTLYFAIDNPKTREGAITTIRKILKDYEQNNEGLIIMETYLYLKDMREKIVNDEW